MSEEQKRTLYSTQGESIREAPVNADAKLQLTRKSKGKAHQCEVTWEGPPVRSPAEGPPGSAVKLWRKPAGPFQDGSGTMCNLTGCPRSLHIDEPYLYSCL